MKIEDRNATNLSCLQKLLAALEEKFDPKKVKIVWSIEQDAKEIADSIEIKIRRQKLRRVKTPKVAIRLRLEHKQANKNSTE